MKNGKWLDKWYALSLGQRRVTMLLLVLMLLLAVAQIVASYNRAYVVAEVEDFAQLEQEVAAFRLHLDTVPLHERRPVYHRRTHARRDTSLVIEASLPRRLERPTPRAVDAVPRIDAGVKIDDIRKK